MVKVRVAVRDVGVCMVRDVMGVIPCAGAAEPEVTRVRCVVKPSIGGEGEVCTIMEHVDSTHEQAKAQQQA